MSPRGAVLGLSIAGAVALSVAVLLATPEVAISLITVGVLCSILLNNGYARALKSARRPLSRVPFDRLVALEILGAFAPPLMVAGLLALGAVPAVEVDLLWEVIAAVVAGVVIVCFLSSLVDWYYVLPRRDGLVGPPPCKAPKEPHWQRVTWFWSVHRLAAAMAVLGSVYGIAICIGLWLNGRYPELSNSIGGAVAILLGMVTYFARKYLTHIVHVWQELFSSPPALGEQVKTKRNGDPLSGYVLNVSIERFDLLTANDALTHVSHAEVADCHHDKNTALCRERCVRGNADATVRPPTGGHGGCLYETEERYLEEGPARRVFVF